MTRQKIQTNSYPIWAMRFWHGMRIRDWFRLASQHRFRIHPAKWGLGFTVTVATLFNSTMSFVQRLWYQQQIDSTQIKDDPIFILGHWRSGTTFLHELMVRDERFAFPTTYQCFAPSHFLISEWFFTKFLWFMLPSKRPMDNMATGFNRPQEDEFALMNLGAPSPYLRMAFPNDPPPYTDFLNMDEADPELLAKWKTIFVRFLKSLTYKYGKQIILKSPPHTGRIGVLADLFPHAKFIHITRDPFDLFPSTMRTWKSLDDVQSFQNPHFRDLEEYVFDSLVRMYHGYEKQRASVAPQRIYEVQYEQLVRDPIGELEQIYHQLELGSFDDVRPKIEAFVGDQKDYQPNVHQLDSATKEQIRQRWADYLERYGYAEAPARN